MHCELGSGTELIEAAVTRQMKIKLSKLATKSVEAAEKTKQTIMHYELCIMNSIGTHLILNFLKYLKNSSIEKVNATFYKNR